MRRKMLNRISTSFKVLSKGSPATQEQVDAAVKHFGGLPQEFIDLTREATEVEIQHQGGQYLRIWGQAGCMEMDEGYGIRKRIPNALPIGDDGGGQVLFYGHGNQGEGLYHVGYGNLDLSDAIWIAATLVELLENAKGIEAF